MATPASRRYDTNHPKKILIAGGSGFIGSTVASALWKAERSVGVLSRSATDARSRLQNIEIDYVQADILEPRSLPRALKGADTIISCVELPAFPGKIHAPIEGIQ